MFEITAGANDIKPGRYKAVLEKVEIKTSGEFGEFRKWSFLADVDGALVPISGVTSMANSPQSKGYAWLKALLRRDLKAGEKIDSPVGQNVTLVIELNKKNYPAIKDLEPLEQPEQVEPGIPR